MTRSRYARSASEAKQFRSVVAQLLDCPMCGCSECVSVQRSSSAVVERCTECGLRWHVRRRDLASAVRTRANRTTGDERIRLYQVAELVDALPDHQGGARTEWRDETLADA